MKEEAETFLAKYEEGESAMNYRKALRLTTGLVLTMLFLSACGAPASIPSTATPPSVPPTSTPAPFPTGKFTAKDGDWVFELNDDGSYTFSEFRTVEAAGVFSVQGDQFVLETDSYCDPIGAGIATYTWTFENDTLLFQVKGEDKCTDRLAVLDNVPYHKEQ